MDNNSGRTARVSTIGVVQIVFIILKFAKLIKWSWWTVFIPTFIELGIVFIFLIIGLIITCLKK